ncbi:MAG: trigger factor [Neomegalonema sp.]
MQVTETSAEGLKRVYAAKAPAVEIENKIDEKIQTVRKDFTMKGFRKGKAPLTLLKKMFGKSVMGEVMQELVDDALRAHFEESGHRPTAQPDVKIVNEDFKEGDDLDVEFSYEMMPEIPEVDFAAISLQRLVVEPDETAITETLEKLAADATSFEEKEGAAEDADQVVIDFVGKVDGEAFEGGSAEDFPLTLGSGQFIPGFEEQLVGLKVGDEKAVEVTFPAEYGAENLAGKDAVFDVNVKEVRAPKASEIDDELAKKYGAEDLDALKTQISDRLSEEYRGAARALTKRELLDKLNEAVACDLPATMVEPEAKAIAHQLWHDENPDVDPSDHSHQEIEPTQEHDDLAVRRVKLGLLLADVGRVNEIDVTDAELNTASMQQARQHPGQEKAFFDYIRNTPQAMQSVRAPLFEDKVIDYVFELAAVTEKNVSADDLKAALEELDKDDE